VQSVQDDRRAVGELPQDQGGVHLIGRLRAEAARGRETLRRQHGALFRHPDERRPERPFGEELTAARSSAPAYKTPGVGTSQRCGVERQTPTEITYAYPAFGAVTRWLMIFNRAGQI
jgi:hypothetical protein